MGRESGQPFPISHPLGRDIFFAPWVEQGVMPRIGPGWPGDVMPRFWPLAVVCVVLAISSASSFAECRLRGSTERVPLSRVVDGDTLVLKDGRRLRIIGINTPEKGRNGAADEAFAEAARAAARQYLQGVRSPLIQRGSRETDKYGRLLVHVFRDEYSDSLASDLLARGLGWRIAIPPNLGYGDCLQGAEDKARSAARGVWSDAFLQSAEARTPRQGFRLLRARLVDISFKDSWWLETDGGFVARVMARDQHGFDRDSLKRALGSDLEFRGWMYERSTSGGAKRGYQPWVLLLRHPSSLQLSD